MSNVEGVRITLPDDTVFFGEGNLQVQIEHNAEWLLSGGNTVIGVADWLFDNYAGSVLQTPLATGHLGAASGSRTFEIAFDEWEGNANTWGPITDPDTADIDEKMAVLDMELAQAKVDSLNPAQLEFGPFSATSSRYDPIPVVFPQISPTLDFGERPNAFRPRVTCAETVDLTQEIDGGTATPDYRLTSPNATDDVPISADTLGAGGRGTGRQTQGNEVSQSGLAAKNDANATAGSPTSQGTKILPRSVRLRGAFRGANAADLADRLRTQYLSNIDVETVTLEAPGLTGTTPLTGEYVLGADSAIDPITPQVSGGLYGFELDLQEA